MVANHQGTEHQTRLNGLDYLHGTVARYLILGRIVRLALLQCMGPVLGRSGSAWLRESLPLTGVEADRNAAAR
jgi:hypothetical protein